MAKPVPLEDLPVNVVPASDLPGPAATPAAPEDIGRLEAILTGLERRVDLWTGGLGSAVNRGFAAPFTEEGRKGIADTLRTIGRRYARNVREVVPGLEFTPEDAAARRADVAALAQEGENQQAQDRARQYRVHQARPGWSTAGGVIGDVVTFIPGQVANLGTTLARNAAEGLAASKAALAQRGVVRLLRNPGGIGKMAAESVGTPEKAEVLQSVLDNPAMRPHGGTDYPEQVVMEARNVLRQVQAQMAAANAPPGANH